MLEATSSPPLPWCGNCPLRAGAGFQDFTEAELDLIASFKVEHRRVPAGADLFAYGDPATHLFTLYSGWAYRYRLLNGGRRQILGMVLPGELTGTPGAIVGRYGHSLRAATAAEFCVLSFAHLPQVLRDGHGLPMRLLWLAAHEQRMLERVAVTLGRCSAEEALAGFALDLRDRLSRRGLLDPNGLGFAFPLGQAEVADHLGMTVVHLNRVLRRMEERALLRLRRGRLEILDLDGLRALSCVLDPEDAAPHPLL